MLSYNTYRPGGPWEYEMFTEVLTFTKYPEKKKFALIHPMAPLHTRNVPDYDNELAKLIDKAVRNLLQRVSAQGWEPFEAYDADSLWAKGRVRYEDGLDIRDRADHKREVEPATVSILCRRRVKYRDSQVTTQRESTTFTSPKQGRSRS